MSLRVTLFGLCGNLTDIVRTNVFNTSDIASKYVDTKGPYQYLSLASQIWPKFKKVMTLKCTPNGNKSPNLVTLFEIFSPEQTKTLLILLYQFSYLDTLKENDAILTYLIIQQFKDPSCKTSF